MIKIRVFSLFFLCAISCYENNKAPQVVDDLKFDDELKYELLTAYSDILRFYQRIPDSMIFYDKFRKYDSLEKQYMLHKGLSKREQVLFSVMRSKKQLIVGNLNEANSILQAIPDDEPNAKINHLFIKGVVHKLNSDNSTAQEYFKKTVFEFEQNPNNVYCRLYHLSKVLLKDNRYLNCQNYEVGYNDLFKRDFSEILEHMILNNVEL
jgi:hypothetical protein